MFLSFGHLLLSTEAKPKLNLTLSARDSAAAEAVTLNSEGERERERKRGHAIAIAIVTLISFTWREDMVATVLENCKVGALLVAATPFGKGGDRGWVPVS